MLQKPFLTSIQYFATWLIKGNYTTTTIVFLNFEWKYLKNAYYCNVVSILIIIFLNNLNIIIEMGRVEGAEDNGKNWHGHFQIQIFGSKFEEFMGNPNNCW